MAQETPCSTRCEGHGLKQPVLYSWSAERSQRREGGDGPLWHRNDTLYRLFREAPGDDDPKYQTWRKLRSAKVKLQRRRSEDERMFKIPFLASDRNERRRGAVER